MEEIRPIDDFIIPLFASFHGQLYAEPFIRATRFSKFVSISRGRKRGREFQAVDRLAKEKFEKVKFKSRKASLRAN